MFISLNLLGRVHKSMRLDLMGSCYHFLDNFKIAYLWHGRHFNWDYFFCPASVQSYFVELIVILKPIICTYMTLFIRPFLKNRTYYGNICGGRRRPIRFPLSNSNNSYRILTKLGHNAYRHDISVKFVNQPDRPRHFGVMIPCWF